MTFFSLCFNSSIRPIDRTLSGATTPEHSGRGIDSNEDILRTLQSSSINCASLSDTEGDLLFFRDTVSVYDSPK